MMRTLLEDIIYGRKRGLATLPLRAILRMLSFLYGGVILLKAVLYRMEWLTSERIPCRVVSIGNITVGGTGKTPVAIMTARMLREAGKRVVVVSRGYASTSGEVRVVADGAHILLSSAESGDEPHLIASSLPGTPVVVGRRRAEAARLAWERFRPDVILLDDAFQHVKLKRDLDIVTLDADSPFGIGRLLPRGSLREPSSALERAGAVLLTRFSGNIPALDREREIRRLHPGIPIFYSRHVPVALRAFPEGTIFPPDSLRGTKVAALSNIAVPDSFHRTLESLGAGIAWKRSLPDHHRYDGGEMNEIGNESLARGADILVMTAKDERDLPEGGRFGSIQAYVLDVEAVLIAEREKFLKMVEGV